VATGHEQEVKVEATFVGAKDPHEGDVWWFCRGEEWEEVAMHKM
jgi:hypothetical protein